MRKHTLTAIALAAGSFGATYYFLNRPAPVTPAPRPQALSVARQFTQASKPVVKAPATVPAAVPSKPSQYAPLIEKIRRDAARMDALLSDNDKGLVNATFSPFDAAATCNVEIQELPSMGNGNLPAYNAKNHLLSSLDMNGNTKTRDALVWAQTGECGENPADKIMGGIRAAYFALDKTNTDLKQSGFSAPQYELTVSAQGASGGTALSFICQNAPDGFLRCASPIVGTPSAPRSYNLQYMHFDPVLPQFTSRPQAGSAPNP